MDHLLGILVAMLQWLQPLLTPSNYDTLVASLLQKASPAPCMTARSRHEVTYICRLRCWLKSS